MKSFILTDDRLRRAVLHPSLVLGSEEQRAMSPGGDGFIDVDEILKSLKDDNPLEVNNSTNVFAAEVLSNLNEDDSAECPICLDVMDRPMIIPECMHKCCKDCITMFITTCEEKGQEPGCPTCSRHPIKVALHCTWDASFLIKLTG